MTDMLERVARAIARESCNAVYAAECPVMDENCGCYREARAAIEALRADGYQIVKVPPGQIIALAGAGVAAPTPPEDTPND